MIFHAPRGAAYLFVFPAMSQTNAQLRSLEELDARVDALVDDIHTSSASVQSALPHAPESVEAHGLDDTDFDSPPPPSAIDPALGSPARLPISFDESDFAAADIVLQEVAGEIQPELISAPSPAPAAEQGPVAQQAPIAPAAAEPEAKVHTTESEAAAPPATRTSSAPEAPAASLDAALADAADEIAAVAGAPATAESPALEPAGTIHDHVTSVIAAASDEHPEIDTPDAGKRARLETAADQPPVADIDQLDQALAANADKALEDAQRELDDLAIDPAPNESAQEPAAVEPQPIAKPEALAPTPAPVPAAPISKPVAVPAAPAPAAEVVSIPPAEPRPSRFAALAGALVAPLRPLAAFHAKLSDQTRQTIAYIAIMNVFFASVVWFFALQRPVTRDPLSTPIHNHASDEEARAAKAARHDDHADAHGAAAQDSGHGAASHGSSDAHGAKKTETKKAEPKKADAKKSASTKSSKKKTEAKADAHGGH